MRFMLVNARTLRPQSFCAMCNQPIGTSYLREVGTNLIYCDLASQNKASSRFSKATQEPWPT